MARVPVAGKRVERQPLPAAGLSVSAGAGAFGGLEAEAIKEIGGIVSGIGEVVQKRESALEKAQLEFKERNDKLWADTKIIETQDFIRSSRGAYSQLTGVDSFGITSRFDADLERQKKSVLDSAQNEEQKRFYEGKFAAKREAALNTAQSYEVTEFKNTEQATLDSIIENTIRDAGDISGDTTVDLANTQIGLFSLRKSLDDAITRKTAGMPVATAKNVRAEVVSAFHESILNKKVVADAENAQQYYNINKKEILPEKREGVEKVLKTEDTLQFAQTKTDEIVLMEPDRSKWSELARKSTDDPDKRKETVDLIKVRKKELDQLDKEQKEQLFLDTLNKVDVSQNQEEGDGFAKRLEDPIDRAKALKVSEAKFEKKIKDLVTDRTVQAAVYERIDAGLIKDVSQLIEFSPDLSTADYNRLITELRNKSSDDPKIGFIKYTTAKTAYETVKGKKYDVDKDAKEFMFVQDKLDQHAQALGRDLTPVEANKFAAQAIVDGESFGDVGFLSFGRPEQTLMDATQDGTVDTWLPLVNSSDIDGGEENRAIKDALKGQGIVTDDEVIFRLYKKEAILNIPLSDKQVKLLQGRINRVGISRPLPRFR